MPKPTFYNLPLDKQNRIVVAAVSEFMEAGYRQAAVESIAQRAGVAKGSLYQYFHSKRDLFLYFCRVVTLKKMEYLDLVRAQNPGLGFLATQHQILLEGLRMARQMPDYQRIYQDFNERLPVELREAVNREVNALGLKYYRDWLGAAVATGEIRGKMDLDLTAGIVYNLAREFGDYMVNKLYESPPEQVEQAISGLIDILRRGIEEESWNDRSTQSLP